MVLAFLMSLPIPRPVDAETPESVSPVRTLRDPSPSPRLPGTHPAGAVTGSSTVTPAAANEASAAHRAGAGPAKAEKEESRDRCT